MFATHVLVNHGDYLYILSSLNSIQTVFINEMFTVMMSNLACCNALSQCSAEIRWEAEKSSLL